MPDRQVAQYTAFSMSSSPFSWVKFVNRVRQLTQNRRTWSRMCAKILAYVTYVGKYQKVYLYQASHILVLPSDFPNNIF